MSSHENTKHARNNDGKLSRPESVDGVKSWMIVMVAIFSILLGLDNYKRFGIKKGPFEIVFQVVYVIIQHWWLLGLTLIYFFQQTAHMILLEKMLLHGVISEKVGMTLHALNAFFLPTACLITVRNYETHIVVTRLLMVYILFVITKTWSYAYINSTYRRTWRQRNIANNKKEEDKQLLTRYPHTVTAKNTIIYMFFTPPVQYQHSYPERTNPDWRNFSLLALQLFLVYCGMNFFWTQFVLPELLLLKHLGGGGNVEKLECSLRIMLPFNLVWLLYYAQSFKSYLPAYAALTGMNNLAFSSDWWNSTDLNEFWRKWNEPVHRCLKLNVVLPLIRNGYTPGTASFVAFAVAGVIHEYVNMLPFGIYSGIGFILTMGEIPAGYLTVYIARRFGRKCGNIMIWIYIVISHSITIVYISLTYDIFS